MPHHHLHHHFVGHIFSLLFHGWLLVMLIGQLASWLMDGIVPWFKRRTHWGNGFRLEDEYPPRTPG